MSYLNATSSLEKRDKIARQIFFLFLERIINSNRPAGIGCVMIKSKFTGKIRAKCILHKRRLLLTGQAKNEVFLSPCNCIGIFVVETQRADYIGQICENSSSYTEKPPKGANRARRQCNSQRILCAREFSQRDILSLINIKITRARV